MTEKVSRKIPVLFQEMESIDDRFIKMKIWIVNVGKNYNGSIFTKEAIEKAIPTIYNTPLLGYIEENRLGEKDFSDHRYELVIENGEMKEKHLGSAFGVIPESCNPQFELRENELGGVEEYLTVEAILWRKMDDAVSIVERDGVKNQSMELSEKYSGKFNEDGYFVFDEFEFYGACMLGDLYSPAVPQSTVEMMFARHENSIQKEVQKKYKEYTDFLFAKHFEEKEVDEVTLEELLNKFNITEEDISNVGIEIENYSIEELEVVLKEKFESAEVEGNEEPVEESKEEILDEQQEEVEESEEVVEEEVEVEFEENVEETTEEVEESAETIEEDEVEEAEEITEEKAEKFTKLFSLSHEDIRAKLWEHIDRYMFENVSEGWYWIVQVYDDHCYIQNESDAKYYKLGYKNENDEISIVDHVEVYSQFLTAEEKGALEILRVNMSALESEVEELRTFKVNVEKLQHEERVADVFAKFSKLTEEDIADIKENLHSYTVEEIESKCFEVLGRKLINTSFSKQKEQSKLTLKFTNNASGRYDHYFKKHGIRK